MKPRVRVSTAGAKCMAVYGPVPVVDFETGKERLTSDGKVLHEVQVVIAREGEKIEVFDVKVPGEPKGLKLWNPIKVTDLVATPWHREDQEGISYRAASIEPDGAPRP